MRNQKLVNILLLAAVTGVTAGIAHADPFLSVQMVDITDGANSPSQQGFSPFGTPNTATTAGVLPTHSFPVKSPAVKANSVTVDIAGGTAVDGNGDLDASNPAYLGRDRGEITGSGTFTNAKLYEAFATPPSGNMLGIEIAGLDPETSYRVTFYAFDPHNKINDTFTNITDNASAPSATVKASAGTDGLTSNDVDAVTLTAKTDAKGRLLFSESGDIVILNGFEVSAAASGPTTGATTEPAKP